MKKYIAIISALALGVCSTKAQETVYPTPAHKGITIIKNGTVHVGNGQVLQQTDIQVVDSKIEKLGSNLAVPSGNVTVIDAAGKHVYPGLILSNTKTGLKEIGSAVKGSNDFDEMGELNPSIRSIVAYNTDSKIINTLRSNGILLANIAPQGNLLAGNSSVVQFDAWNWEDAAYHQNTAMHFYMPSLFNRPRRGVGSRGGSDADPVKSALDKIDMVKEFFRQAKAYQAQKNRTTTNLKFEAVKSLFDKKEKLFVHCNLVKEMLVAIDFVNEFGFDVTIVGGSESYQVAPLLKQHNIAVILQQLHNLPTSEDDDVDQPFKTPLALQQAGVLFALTDEDGQTTGRNLAFNAGTAASYGLSKEEALQAITLNAAKILGIANRTGSIEVGKDANIIISNGDLLDMKSSVVTTALIEGRNINLDDKHKQLNERYKKKYEIK